MVCSRTYILIEEEDFRRMSDYDRNVLKLCILDILNSSSPDEEFLMPLHFVDRRNTAVIRIGADILSFSFSHSIEQTRLDNHFDFAFTESRASPAPSSNRIAIMKSISKNGDTDCKVIQFGCEDAGIRFPNGCDELWTNMHWSYHNIRDPRSHSDLDSKVVSSNCSEPGPSSTCTEDANLIADLSELLWGERSAVRSPHLYKLLLQSVSENLLTIDLEKGALYITLTDQGRAMRQLIRIVDKSSTLRFECIDDREYSIHNPDPMESMLGRIRACLVYGYGLFNIHFTPSHRGALKDFISHMNYQDDVGIMTDALLYVANSRDDLRSVFDGKMDGVIPDSLDFEEFQRLSIPLIRIFDNMLGDALSVRDEIDEYSYRRSIRTPLRNCIAVAVFGSPSKPFTTDEYYQVLEPYCCDHGCLLWDIINDIHHDMDPPIDKIPFKDIVSIIAALQGLGIQRSRDPIHKTLSILAEKGDPLAKYQKFLSWKLITDIDFDTFAAMTEGATKALNDNFDGCRI